MKMHLIAPLLVAAALVFSPAHIPERPSHDATVTTAADQVFISGTYRGTLPCDSCSGIRTTLVLNNDKSFELTEEFEDPSSSDTPKIRVLSGFYYEQTGRVGNSRAAVIRLSESTSVSKYIEVINRDEIRMLDQYERPFDVGRSYSLYRM